MGFASDITGTLAGLLPAQQSVLSGLAAPPLRRVDKNKATAQRALTPAGDVLPIALIREAVQECLQDSILDTAGSLHALMADDEIVDLLHKLLGRPGERQTVGRSLQDVVDAFSALAAKDGQPADVVAAIERFIEKLKSTTLQLGQLRRFAAEQMTQSVTEANDLLTRIAEVNRQIGLQGATGQATNNAAKLQQGNLADLAKTIDFTSFRRDDGTIAVFTKRGVTLATGDAHGLAATETGISAEGIDIAAQLSGGAVHGYMHNRDVALPNVQRQLDTLAQTLQSRINQVANRALAGADARGSYRGSRQFVDPAGCRIGLGGGDTEIALINQEGLPVARAGLAMTVKHYRRQAGLPGGSLWPIGQVAAALNLWTRRQLAKLRNDPGFDIVRLSEQGQLLIDLPADSGLRLAFRDRRSLALQTIAVAAPDKSLGLQGQMILSDGLGNEFSTSPARGGVALSPTDSLVVVAAKLGRLDGLTASLCQDGQDSRLVIASRAGSDLVVEPDGANDSFAITLAPVPADDQAQEDVAINAVTLCTAATAISRPFAKGDLGLGLQGSLVLRDLDGAPLSCLSIQPDATLESLAADLRDASSQRLSATVIATGNRCAVKISSLTADQRFVIDGWPEGWQTSPRSSFAASGGMLQISLAGSPVGTLSIEAGSSFAQIVEQLTAAASPWNQTGLRAQRLSIGETEILDIGHVGGLPLAFSGSAVGQAAGQLDFRYNIRDQLGLAPPADQVVPGFANFFGLNDLFVADPADVFDSKAAIGVFTTTAAPGTAGALALNPSLAQDPARLGTAATIRQISDLLCNSLNIAAAGDLPKGSFRLAQYADAIVNRVHQAARTNKLQLSYHRTLFDQLGRQKSGEIDVNDRLDALMTLQQTYQDSTQIVAGLSRLADSLQTPAH